MRPGDLSPGWRIVVAAAWIGVIIGFAAIWNASDQLGLRTWWLGPRGQPRPRLVQLSPFVAPALMLFATLNRVRWLPWLGLAASAVVAGFAAGDLDPFSRLGVAQLVIAAAAALVSIASLSGMYRR